MGNSSSSGLNLFFPLSKGGLNKQQFISDILSPQIQRGSNLANRSGLAKVIYDKQFPKDVVQIDSKVHALIKDLRPVGRENILSFNPNFYQEFEESYSAIRETDPIEQQKYNEYVKFMTKIGTTELAVMQPFVKLIYRYRKNEGEPWREITMPFPSFTTEDEFLPVLSSKFARGDGSGIENITVNRKFPQFGNFLHVTVAMNFYFQNLGIFTREIKIPGHDFPTPFSFLKVMSPLSKETEQLVIEYGYSLNTRFTDPSIIPPPIQEQIMRRERKRFIVSYYKHNFNIEQNGSVRLSVNYTSQQDFDLYKETSNIALPENENEIQFLATGNDGATALMVDYARKRKEQRELEKSIKESRLEVTKRKGRARIRGLSQGSRDIIKLERKVKTQKEQLKRINVNINTLKDQLVVHTKPVIIDSMITHMDVFKASFSTQAKDVPGEEGSREFSLKTNISLVTRERNSGKLKDISLFEIPSTFSTDEFDDNLVLKTLDGKNEKQKQTLVDNIASAAFNAPRGLKSTASGDKKFGDMMFFSVRSLISAAYRQLNEQDRKTAHFTSLGNINAKTLGKNYMINLGDVLVELTYFQKWYYETYTKKRKLTIPLGEFIDDVVKKLVPSILESNTIETFGRSRIGAVQRTNYLTELTPKNAQSLFDDLYLNTNRDKLRQLASSVRRTSETKTSKQLRTFVHYSLVRNPSSPVGSAYLKRKVANTNFREDNDIEFGCPHIKIGADEGLLKNISFNANDFAGLRTGLWVENLRDSATNLLRYHYSAQVETIGNNVFFKGGFFGLPPNLLGIENDDFDPGISGYYAIQEVNDSLSLGDYTTSLTATWFYNPRLDKTKKGETVKDGQNKTDELAPIRVSLSFANYLEETLRLDSNTLSKYGIGPGSTLSRSEQDEEVQGVQKDKFKDIKETF